MGKYIGTVYSNDAARTLIAQSQAIEAKDPKEAQNRLERSFASMDPMIAYSLQTGVIVLLVDEASKAPKNIGAAIKHIPREERPLDESFSC